MQGCSGKCCQGLRSSGHWPGRLHSLHTSEAPAMYLTTWETQTPTKAWLEFFGRKLHLSG